MAAALADGSATYQLGSKLTVHLDPTNHQLIAPVYEVSLTPVADGANYVTAHLARIIDQFDTSRTCAE